MATEFELSDRHHCHHTNRVSGLDGVPVMFWWKIDGGDVRSVLCRMLRHAGVYMYNMSADSYMRYTVQFMLYVHSHADAKVPSWDCAPLLLPYSIAPNLK